MPGTLRKQEVLAFKFDDVLPPSMAVPGQGLAPKLAGRGGLEMIGGPLKEGPGHRIAVVGIFLGLDETFKDICVASDDALFRELAVVIRAPGLSECADL